MNIRITQRTNNPTKTGKSPLFLRFTHNRQSKFISLKVAILPEYWNSTTQTISANCPKYEELQNQINNKLAQYKRKALKLEVLEIEVTFDSLLETKKKTLLCTIEDYFTMRIEQMKQRGKVSTASKYKFCLVALKKSNNVNIRFDQLDMQYLREFESYLIDNGNATNSIATKLSVLKALYNHAINDGVFTPNDNPFTKFKVGKLWKPTPKRAISKDEINSIKQLELPINGNSFYLGFARDIFMFSYYTAGMNFKDIATFKLSDIHNGKIHYSRHKTSKNMHCYLLPEAQLIIDKYKKGSDNDYVFPILNQCVHTTELQIFNRVHKVLTKINSNLKSLGGMIGLKMPLTTYVARHTFATVLKKSGVNIAIISESLGHSDLATTQIYLDSFESSQIKDAMQNLL